MNTQETTEENIGMITVKMSMAKKQVLSETSMLEIKPGSIDNSYALA
jgi:hypothetical protein